MGLRRRRALGVIRKELCKSGDHLVVTLELPEKECLLLQREFPLG